MQILLLIVSNGHDLHHTDLSSVELCLSLKYTGVSIDWSLFRDTQLGSGESELFVPTEATTQTLTYKLLQTVKILKLFLLY